MNADFGKTASDYRIHRAGFPESFFQTLRKRRLVNRSETVVDLGTGTGTVARELAAMGCKVTGVDPSKELLAEAADMAVGEDLKIRWIAGTAENTGTEDRSVDVVTAGQCWHWFDAKRAVKEVRRILKDGGLLLIAHFDWLPIQANVVWHTEKLIEAANPTWNLGGGIGVYPDWYRHLSEGYFTDIESFTYQELMSYTHIAWRGRIRASVGVGGSMNTEMVRGIRSAPRNYA